MIAAVHAAAYLTIAPPILLATVAVAVAVGYAPWVVGAWLSLVEHSVRDRGVGGSNPLAPTN